MEVSLNLDSIFAENLVRLDAMAIKRIQHGTLESAIDRLASLSSESMHHEVPLTSCEKITRSDNILYLKWGFDNTKNANILIGYLKIGLKKLFLYDTDMKPYDAELVALLDFYVHHSYQRQGNGRQLFEMMLAAEKVTPYQIAFDNPTAALLAFLGRHYGLSDPVWQNTNFAVFKQIFECTTDDAEAAHTILDDDGPPNEWRRPGARRIARQSISEQSRQAQSRRMQSENKRLETMHQSQSADQIEVNNETESSAANRLNQARKRKAHILSNQPLW